ncbi:MAG TPA: FtsX-like permease family protein, partial [Terriglobales bacterium]|nr:FtsX-like permease family protein [Terriglobales bacterium]
LQPDLPVFDAGTLTASMNTLSGFLVYRLGAGLAVALGLLGLLLAMIGLYGTLSYATGQRTREIGIRMALGAGRGRALAEVLLHAARMVGAGLACGCVAAWIAARLAASLLAGAGGFDPLAYLGIALAMSAVALAACYFPARRAMNVDPVRALRQQ